MTHLVLRCLLALAVPVAVLQVPAVNAQPAPSDAAKRKAARAYVDAGLAAQNAGDYDTAITFYTKAYQVEPHPLLLFNVAQAHRLARREDRAIAFYRRFLATNPTGREARLARDLLAELEQRRAEEAREDEEEREAAEARKAAEAREPDEGREAGEAGGPDGERKADRQPKADATREVDDAAGPSQPPPRPEHSPWYRDAIGDVLVLGGATSLVLGGLAYRAARLDLDTAETVATHEQALELEDGAKTKRLIGVTLAGIGVGLVGAGVLRFVLRDARPEARRVGIAPARGGGLITFARSF